MRISTPHKTEADLRVAQELKNNQDFIYQTNQELQNLRKLLEALSQKHDNLLAKFDSTTKGVLIEFENHSKDNRELSGFLAKKVNEFEKKYNQLLAEIAQKVDHISKYHPALADVEAKFNKVGDAIESLHVFLNQLSNTLSSSSTLLQGQIKEECKQIRQDLAPKPLDHLISKEEIREILLAYETNFKGLQREIELLKKSVGYGEKKFENIYTLIERLKAGKNVPSG